MNILYAVVSGALAGLLSWFVFSLSFIVQESPVLNSLIRGLILGVIFGGLLGVAKGLGDKSSKKNLSGLLDGLVMGVTGGVASQFLIMGFGLASDKKLLFSLAGWALFGLFLGAGQSLDKPSVKGITYGIIGGLVGGGLGGILLNFLSSSFKAAWWGQAAGMVVFGMALGAAINAMLLPLEKEEKKAAPAKPAAAPPEAKKPEIKAEIPQPAPVQPVISQPAPVQPLKRWLEANFLIEKSQISIGSSQDNDIIIRMPGIEQKQALIYQDKGRFLIKNTGASKEVFVSFTGDLIQGRNLASNDSNALKEGSVIRADKESLMFFHSSPPSLSVRYPIDKAKIVIGTGLQNDIVINDAGASSRHAQISWEKERGMVIDLGSSSGTYVSYGGDKAQERKVQDKNAITNNSLIRIGNVSFRVLG